MKLSQYLSITAGGPGSGRHPGFGEHAPTGLGDKKPAFKNLPPKLENAIRQGNPYRAKLIGTLIELAEKAEADMKTADPYSVKQLTRYAKGMRDQAKSLSDAWGLSQ